MERKEYNKFGNISTAPGGYGTISKKGYRRIWCTEEKRYRMEHRVVWSKNFGAIPNKCQIHHKDGNKLNNDITNLELVTPLQHKREHSGCELRADGWHKPCRMCGELKHADNYYKSKEGWLNPRCKKCNVKVATENKRKRKQV